MTLYVAIPGRTDRKLVALPLREDPVLQFYLSPN